MLGFVQISTLWPARFAWMSREMGIRLALL